MGLSLLLLLDLGGLVLHLTGTSKGAMDLTTSTETKNEVESRFLLNVVIGKGAAVLELLSGENQTLLIWGNSLLILNLSLHVLDGVRRLDVESDRLS